MWWLRGCSPAEPASKNVSASTREQLAFANEEHACPLDRFYIEELGPKLKPFMPKTSVSAIAELLRTQVNLPNDKVPKNLENRFTPEDSISAYEAFTYSQKLISDGVFEDGSASAQLAHGLITFYFGYGDPLRTVPPPHKVTIKHCHDGDTCTILETQDPACRISEAQIAVRISGIDAPELGVYYGPWTNQKLIENVNKLREEWFGKTKPSNDALMTVNKLIALRINYTGQLAGLVRNDLHMWNQTQEFERLFEESQIEWMWKGAGDQTPPALCGMWQPYDKFDRRLGSFYEPFPSFLKMYLQTRLSELMAKEGVKKHDGYLKKAAPLLEKLKTIEDPKIKAFVKKLENNVPDPRFVFSQAECELMAVEFAKLVEAHGDHYALDDQMLQIITGSVYAYEKYRNQDGDVYQMANDVARYKGFGFWTDPTFSMLYMINERDPRYHPPHCQ
jgi:hypothetical protein